ncbi:DUF2950 domain-containing protein [Rhodobacter sp. CZR27]|uniref:DUF2950 domain-containing protein n=1 Tax=Rhodobacter sp. CZR27 TaxID=2033869 RepID=UPI0012FD8F36|nr:DUF2950 domain-containing protein [Rhodobacter sp. CZR27]
MTNIPTRGLTTALLGCLAASAAAEPARFASPEEAVEALVAAGEAADRAAILRIFGPEFEDLIFTGDAEADAAARTGFLHDYGVRHRIDRGPDEAILHIGREDWPFPAPIVRKDEGWSFDGESAREEVRLRRIGLNELDVIDVMRAAVRVQALYRQTDHDGDGVLEFAAGILSTAGTRDGLYWPDEPGTEQSPIGAFIARASADGYNFDGTDSAPEPYLDYYFRILQKQGPSAPGGEMDYMVNGNMLAGHAILAYPANYGETGIMSFMVGENGIVLEADLGPDTLAIGNETTVFDPGEGWTAVE